MKKSDKDPSKGTSFWGMVFSIVLHASVIVLILFWGFRGASEYSGSSGPIQVSLSSLETGQGDNAPAKKAQTKKAEPKKIEPKKVEKKEEVKAPPKPPEKKQEKKEEVKKVEEEKKEPEKPKEEPKKEEKPKEVVKKEPEKKEVVPLEPEKKVEKNKEEPKKEELKKKEKKEEKKVAEKPKPTEKSKPKKEEKKAEKKTLDKERSRVLKDIQRQKVLEQLSGSSEEPEEPQEPEEPIGEEQRLAMADDEEAGLETKTETKGPSGGSSGGSSVNPVIVNLYSQQVHRKISRNWRIPPSVPTDGGLVTDLLFKVGQDGKIYDVRVSGSSGNPAFDEYCMNAIYKSAPLPPPPTELAKEAKDKGVIITFRNDP